MSKRIVFFTALLLLLPGIIYAANWNNIRVSFVSDAPHDPSVTRVDIDDPDIAGSDSGYGVVWVDPRNGHRDLYFVVLDSNGIRISEEIQITDYTIQYTGVIRPRIIWSGSEYGIFWSATPPEGPYSNNKQIYFARFDSSGNRLSENIKLTQYPGYPCQRDYVDVVWDGSGYGLVWKQTGNELCFARIDASGNKTIFDTFLKSYSGTHIGRPRITWSGSEYGITWWGSETNDPPREVYFTRIDSNGVKQGNDVRVTYCNDWCGYPSISWNGSSYGLLWRNVPEDKTYFSKVSSDGVVANGPVEVVSDNQAHVRLYASLVWSGAEYGAVWEDGNTLGFVRLDSDGSKISGIDGIADSSDSYANSPRLIFSDAKYAVVWKDHRNEMAEAYFAFNICYETEIDINIKPGSCPNPLNIKSKGAFPLAILGNEDFDVYDIDVASIRLEGVNPIRSSYEDVATPFEGELCECHELGGDGWIDLTLKFRTQEIVNAIEPIEDGEEVPLTITGTLMDGTPIKGEDCVVIIGKGKK